MWGANNWGELLWGGVQAVPLLGPFGFVAMAVCFILGGWLLQNESRVRWLGRAAMTVLIVAPLVALGAVVVPHSFSNGTVADATEVNANFDALMNESNALDTRVTDLEALPGIACDRSGWVFGDQGCTDDLFITCEAGRVTRILFSC